jgi:uncharacterized protein involved in outer membrane biogenesis
VLSRRRRKILLWTVVIATLSTISVGAVSIWLLHPSRLKARLETTLREQLGLDATIEQLDLRIFPRPVLSGLNLVLRIPGHPDLPPFVSVDHFQVNVGILSGIRKHVETVHLGGLRIVVPPGDAKRDALAPRRTPGAPGDPAPVTSEDRPSKVVIDHLETHDSLLTILRRDPTQDPLLFDIHELRIDGLGFDLAMPFVAKLSNPVPRGEVEAHGTIGPWNADDPSGFPIHGDYIFTRADLGTIEGIGGMLTSTGTYEGRLDRVLVVGETHTPDFNLDLGGKPLPLSARFTALVDATNGTTRLLNVEAKLFNTPIHVKGDIVNLPRSAGHDIRLEAHIADGRIEDLLRLSIDAPKPLLRGRVRLQTTITLAPGARRVRNRLAMSGRFGLAAAKFTDFDVQAKLEELSRRSRGKDRDEELGQVLTDLSGGFVLKRGLLSLTDLSFKVPGATVLLNGTYAIEGEALDFEGQLRMEATVSQAVGGFKSLFLKPFDFIFRKEGAGAVLPIQITGSREHPKMGLKLRRSKAGR